MALTRFEHPGLRAARMTTLVMIFIAAGTISFGILGDPGGDFDEFLGVVLILAILGVICLPLLHKLVGLPPPSETVAMDVKLLLTCPRCGEQQTLPAGPSRCAKCRLRFRIEVEEPRCPKCSYLLYQLTEPRCPECGHQLGADEVVPATVAERMPSPGPVSSGGGDGEGSSWS
jgi:hypothetical protein